jgi:hypothetical protein
MRHAHVDHIKGLPFFASCYQRGQRMRLWAGHLLPENCLQDLLCGVYAAPLFPVPLELHSGQMEFRDFHCGETLIRARASSLRRRRLTIRTGPPDKTHDPRALRLKPDGRLRALEEPSWLNQDPQNHPVRRCLEQSAFLLEQGAV